MKKIFPESGCRVFMRRSVPEPDVDDYAKSCSIGQRED
jgi:hypothetical protein